MESFLKGTQSKEIRIKGKELQGIEWTNRKKGENGGSKSKCIENYTQLVSVPIKGQRLLTGLRTRPKNLKSARWQNRRSQFSPCTETLI